MNDEDVLNKVQQHLNGKLESQSDLPNETIESQLKQARITALDSAAKKTLFPFGLLNRPAVVFAVASLLVLSVTLVNIITTDISVNESIVNVDVDIELLTNEENLDFYDDLEFYEWLLREDQSST